MEYRSPLGFNFKLEKSLSALKDESSSDTPKKDDVVSLDTSGSKKPHHFDNRRTGNRYSQFENSPGQQRNSNNWKSPNPRNSQNKDEGVRISQYFHQSMLEDPWEELERNLK